MKSKIVTLASLLLLTSSLSAHAVQMELIENGGFETGDLSSWTTSGQGTTGGCPGANRDFNVSSTSSTGCSTVGSPFEGNFAAYVMNDAGGATQYTLSQDFLVPIDVFRANLSFSFSSVSSYSGDNRLFSAGIYEGQTMVAGFYDYVVRHSDSNPGWDTIDLDIVADIRHLDGQILELRFTNSIPAAWMGPAGLGLDNVSLIAAVPEPGSLALLGIGIIGMGIAKRRRK